MRLAADIQQEIDDLIERISRISDELFEKDITAQGHDKLLREYHNINIRLDRLDDDLVYALSDGDLTPEQKSRKRELNNFKNSNNYGFKESYLG